MRLLSGAGIAQQGPFFILAAVAASVNSEESLEQLHFAS
jgi:hypothetical protein